MNERIKQLAEQAGSTHKQNLGVYQFYSDELEKFAELLVRECAEVCKAQSTYDPIVLPYKPSEQFEKAIRQHFGVK